MPGSAVGASLAWIDAARRSLHQLVTTGHVAYAYAGIQTEDLTPSLARRLRLPVPFGALVDAVTSGGPADKAGIRGGNGHVSFEGQTVVSGGDVVWQDGRRLSWRLPEASGLYQAQLVIDYGPAGLSFDALAFEVS